MIPKPTRTNNSIAKGAHILKDIQCFKVDGIKILPNIFYRLEDFNENIKNFVEPETKEE